MLTPDVCQVVYLFFLNRYLIPVGFIINIVAYNLQDWSLSVSGMAHSVFIFLTEHLPDR